ncbi:Slp family lipoprotein [Halorhodospira halophila]|uniref:Slp family lipoprotein n=1 Tax=Halorhodospira halophila TaxID=1053 RepID=UPI0002E26755|nr:Slp family lipoprotein [Halorhodospira halophila]
MSIRVLFLVVMAWLLAGCASTVPDPVRSPPDETPSLAQVRDDPGGHDGESVRWGGEIVEVRNEADATWLEIVERPLRSGGQPRDADRSEGRFLARVEGFLEPTLYAPGREFTVAGTLDGTVKGAIGEYGYTYPVVEVAAHHLWQERAEPRQVAPRPYYDPWYDPWCDHRWYRHPGSPYYYGPYRRPYW